MICLSEMGAAETGFQDHAVLSPLLQTHGSIKARGKGALILKAVIVGMTFILLFLSSAWNCPFCAARKAWACSRALNPPLFLDLYNIMVWD